MPIFDSLGNQKPYSKNQFRNSEQGKFFSSFVHEQACLYSNSNSLIKRKCCFFCCWLKAADKESIRLATKNKKPLYWKKSNWPIIKEKRKRQELLENYGEWGTRTGKRIGRKYYVRVDLDLAWLPETLRKNLDRGFLMMMKNHGIIFIKTKRGYHVVLLLSELPPNGSLYHTDKFGVKRKIGDVLSTGRQAQDLGSPEKIQPTQKGKWFWQAKDIQEVSKVWEKYFFVVECKGKTSKKTKSNIKSIEVKNTEKNKNEQTIIKLAQIIKRELFRQRVKRDKPIYKIWFQQSGKSKRYFLLDTYQKHREKQLDQLPVGSINSFILNQGDYYQFYLKTY